MLKMWASKASLSEELRLYPIRQSMAISCHKPSGHPSQEHVRNAQQTIESAAAKQKSTVISAHNLVKYIAILLLSLR